MRARRRLIVPLVAVVLAGCGQPGKGSAQSLQGSGLVGGFAQPDRAPPASSAEMRLSFAPVVKKAAPAVVNVFSRRVVRQQVDPFWQMFGMTPRSGVEQSLGSGVIVRSDGVIVTNHHVIDGGQEIMVVLSDRRQFPAKVLLDDAHADLAVLKVDPGAERLPTIAIDDSGSPQVGDLVLAIGNPFGVGQTVTNGIVSALARSQVGITDYSYFIQTDAAINPGNSGGALVDMDGDLIGLNTSIVSRTGTSTGVGFAIPAAMVKQVVAVAAGGGHAMVRPWLGVKGQDVTQDIAKSLGMDRPEGVLAADVYPGGAADRAGLKVGDVILAVDGQAVNDESAMNYRIATHDAGDRVAVQVRRGGAARTLMVQASPAPASPAKDERVISGRNPLGGATVVNGSPAVAEQLGLDAFAAKGVMVTAVPDDSLAANVGVRPGDVIVEVNGQAISSTGQLPGALAAGGRSWRIVIQRGDQRITGSFRL